MSDLKMHTANLVAKNIEKLTAFFPNCITETRNEQGEIIKGVDFDLLRQELSEVLVEGEQERYTLNWVGKKESILTANAPIAKTLRPCREESVNFDTTENLFIEGDNLDALKLLQENYLGKVKMIYIDPPYNTGNDFIYSDNFAENTEEFLIRSNQVDEDGNRLIANTESNGRFHSDWLSMMYSRLRLARNLLTDDGVIFISIDDNEQANLKRICDEIFGEQNFVANLIWTNKEGGGSSDSNYFRIKHESIICYAKDKINLSILGTEISNRERYNGSDEYEIERGKYYLQKLGMGSIQYSESLDYPIEAPDGTLIFPKDNNRGKKACWRWSKSKFEWGKKNGFIEIKKDSSNIWTVYSKQYLKCDNEGNLINRTQRPMAVIDSFSSTQASKLLEKLNLNSFFSYSKPYELIKWLIERISLNNDIVLDFFSGTSTTAHSVMQLNAEDGLNRRFIMVQLPELIDKKSEAFKSGFVNIADISKERIRRAGTKIQTENSDKQIDIGFRVLKIDSSNMKDIYYQSDQLDKTMLDHMVSHIKEDRTAEDLLFQVMLDWGIELSLPIERKTIDGSEVYFVAGNTLVACFDKFTMNVVNEIAKVKPLRVVSTELAIVHDQDKTNIKERFKQLSSDTEVRFL